MLGNVIPSIKSVDSRLSELIKTITEITTVQELCRKIITEASAEQSLVSQLREIAVAYERKTAKVEKHYDSRTSSQNPGHDIRILSDGSVVCTACAAGIHGKACWALDDYESRLLFR